MIVTNLFAEKVFLTLFTYSRFLLYSTEIQKATEAALAAEVMQQRKHLAEYGQQNARAKSASSNQCVCHFIVGCVFFGYTF